MTLMPEVEMAPRRDQVVPRFLAVTLYSLAAFIGLPTTLGAVGYLIAGQWRTSLLLASATPIVLMLVWLGRVLWSDRSIPTWFIRSFTTLAQVAMVGSLFAQGNWILALCLLALFTPAILALYSPRRGDAMKPAKPAGYDPYLD